MSIRTILKQKSTRFRNPSASELRSTQATPYAEQVQRQLAKGKLHSTLGDNVQDEAYTRQEALDWLQSLKRYGLRDTDLCVEIGCGSLWAAEPLIAFLPPDKFIGLDTTDAFFKMGLERLAAGLLAEKHPRFHVISADVLARVAAEGPDFLFARKVMIHVPAQELPGFLSRICSVLGPTTTAVLEMPPTEKTWQHNKRSWVYCLADVAARLPAGFDLTQGPDSMILRRKPLVS